METIFDANHEVVAHCCVSGLAREECEANAALVARAVSAHEKLVTACKECERLLSAICEVVCPGNPPPYGAEVLALTRAAIAAAEGQAVIDAHTISEEALVIAFVQGAKWWEWYKECATMWPSDRDLAEAAAQARLNDGTLGKKVNPTAEGKP